MPPPRQPVLRPTRAPSIRRPRVSNRPRIRLRRQVMVAIKGKASRDRGRGKTRDNKGRARGKTRGKVRADRDNKVRDRARARGKVKVRVDRGMEAVVVGMIKGTITGMESRSTFRVRLVQAVVRRRTVEITV